MRPIAAVILFTLSLTASAQGSKADWRFVRGVDRITDKVNCMLNGPLSTEVVVSFTSSNLMIVSKVPGALRAGGRLTVRVDKNEPITMTVRSASGFVGTVLWGPDVESLLKQMSNGKRLVARVVSADGGAESEYTLGGFGQAHKSYQGCLAATSAQEPQASGLPPDSAFRSMRVPTGSAQ